MLKCLVLRGLPASGKSTWTKEQIEKHPDRYKRVNRDDLRSSIDLGKYSHGREKHIRQVELMLAEYFLNAGYTPIIDDTNLSPSALFMWQEFAKRMKVELEIKSFTDVPLDTCIERDRHRANYVGEQVIRRMYRDFLQPKPVPPAYDHSLPDALIVDLDGTLALMNGRNPYDASTCENDLVNEPVADIVREFASNGFTILLTSGRSAKHQEQTERWLHAHSFREPYGTYHLFMRKEGDSRRDNIVKREIYEQHIQGKWNIRFVLDDRTQIVRVWRELGLTCLQVAEGDY